MSALDTSPLPSRPPRWCWTAWDKDIIAALINAVVSVPDAIRGILSGAAEMERVGLRATLMALVDVGPSDVNPVVNWPAAVLMSRVSSDHSTESLAHVPLRWPAAVILLMP